MNSQHLTSHEVAGFLERTLAADHLLRLSGHMALCAQCRRQLPVAGAPRMPEIAAELDSPFHPSYAQISVYLAAAPHSAEWESVERHIAICRPCAAEVRDLRLLDLKFADSPKGATADARSNRRPAPAWLRDLFGDLLRSPSNRTFAAACLSLALVGALLVMSNPAATRPIAAGGDSAYDFLRLASAGLSNTRSLAGWLLAVGGTGGLIYGLLRRK